MNLPTVDALISVLREGTYEQRKDATQELVALGETAVEPLIDVMRSYRAQDDYDRELIAQKTTAHHHAEEGLVQIGEPAVDPLIDALRDNTWGARAGAMYCLGEIGDPRAVQPLIESLAEESEEWSPLWEVSEALRKIGTIVMRPLVFALKNHASSQVRYGAAMILDAFPDPLVVQTLIQSAREDDDDAVRVGAIASLGVIGDDRAVPVVMEALQHADESTRELAAAALGRMIERVEEIGVKAGAIEALARVMRDDSDWGARQTAAEHLVVQQTRYATEAVERLVTDLSDPNPEVRLGAGWSLLPLKDARAVDPLTRLLHQSDPRIVRMAAVALGRYGDPRPIPILNALLSSPNEDIRHAANAALKALNPELGI